MRVFRMATILNVSVWFGGWMWKGVDITVVLLREANDIDRRLIRSDCDLMNLQRKEEVSSFCIGYRVGDKRKREECVGSLCLSIRRTAGQAFPQLPTRRAKTGVPHPGHSIKRPVSSNLEPSTVQPPSSPDLYCNANQLPCQPQHPDNMQ